MWVKKQAIHPFAVGPQSYTWSVLDSLEYTAVLGFSQVLYMYTIHKDIYYEELTHVMMVKVGKFVESTFQSSGWKLL